MKVISNTLVLIVVSFSASLFAAKAYKSDDHLLRSVVQLESGLQQGSGFFVNSSGEILTNAHVVEGRDDVVVKLHDGTSVHGKVMARDKKTDLALVKAEVINTPFLVISDETKFKRGTLVKMAGSPLGLDQSILKASISSTNRKINEQDYFQLDGNVNPGLSGGPILDQQGVVIGLVVSMIDNAQGIGFGIKNSDMTVFLSRHGVGITTGEKNQFKKTSKSTPTTNPSSLRLPKAPRWVVVSGLSLLVVSMSTFFIIRAVRKKKKKKSAALSGNVLPIKKENYDDIEISITERKKNAQN